MKLLKILIFLTLIHNSCSISEHDIESNFSDIQIEILAEIGTENQPFDYQLGDPISVITDRLGNVYIADGASQSVKIFDSTGVYLKSIGGRGRGPGEFMQLNLMRITPDGTLLFLDRGKLEYIYLTTEGEYLNSNPVDLANQFYPESVVFLDEFAMGLYMKSSNRPNDPSYFERPLFYIYDHHFENLEATLITYELLGESYENHFLWGNFIPYPGSFDLDSEQNKLIYAPGVYTGRLFEYYFDGDFNLVSEVEIESHPLMLNKTYDIYSSGTEYEQFSSFSGVQMFHHGGFTHQGRLYSIDAGVFYLENGNIAHFYGEWRGGDTTLEEGNTFDLFVQVLSPEGEILNHGFVKSLDIVRRPSLSLVSWKDEQDNFYLINQSKFDAPTVIKFRLEL
jgi:hypothetical protein